VTLLRAERGDVSERPPAPWGFQVVLVRLCSRHRTPHHRSVTTALVWCADTRTAQALAPSGDCSPEPLPLEDSTVDAPSSAAPYTLAGRTRRSRSTTSSAIPICAGSHRLTSAAQRHQIAFHQPTMVSARPSVPSCVHTGQRCCRWLPAPRWNTPGYRHPHPPGCPMLRASDSRRKCSRSCSCPSARDFDMCSRWV